MELATWVDGGDRSGPTSVVGDYFTQGHALTRGGPLHDWQLTGAVADFEIVSTLYGQIRVKGELRSGSHTLRIAEGRGLRRG
jgi:hypothetical protein